MNSPTMFTFKFNPKSQSLLDDYNNGKTLDAVDFISAADGRKTSILEFEVESLSDVLTSEFGHSVLCKFITDEAVAIVEELEETARNSIPEGIDFKSIMLPEDKFFLKLARTADKYKTVIDPEMTPDAPEKSAIHSGSTLAIKLSPGLFINYENKQAGIFFSYKNISIDGGKKRAVRKR